MKYTLTCGYFKLVGTYSKVPAWPSGLPEWVQIFSGVVWQVGFQGSMKCRLGCRVPRHTLGPVSNQKCV